MQVFWRTVLLSVIGTIPSVALADAVTCNGSFCIRIGPNGPSPMTNEEIVQHIREEQIMRVYAINCEAVADHDRVRCRQLTDELLGLFK